MHGIELADLPKATVSIVYLDCLGVKFLGTIQGPIHLNYHRKATADLIRRCLTMRTLGISSLGINKDQKQG